MVESEPTDPGRTAAVLAGRAVSRRDFLKAAGIAGLGVAGAHQLAMAAGRPFPAPETAPLAAPARDAIGELAAALDYDAERIFRFVADEVRYEPYNGILRGARGTLASRAGNSADQALLLAALLEASLLPVRFALGEVDAATADALMARAGADADTLRRHGLAALAGTVPGTEHVPAELPPEQQELLDRAAANGEQVLSWARAELERTVGTIQTALEEAGVEPADSFTPMPDSERSHHVWVQVAETDDWVDLDPTLPGAVRGDALALAAETRDALPEEMAHRVELAVIGESLDGEVLTERRLVGYSERADILAGSPIVVMNTAPEALAALGVSVAGTITGGISYVPVIIAGDEAVVGANPIYFASASASSDAAAEGDGFFEVGPGAGETTAEWVELTIRSPEAEPSIVRREIFDRIGPARRASGQLAGVALAPVDRIDLPDGSTGQAMAALTTHWLTVNTGLPSRGDPVMALVPDEDVGDRAIISQLYHLMGAAASLGLAVPAGYRPFIDAPNVMAHSLVMRPSPDEQEVVESVLDIWHRSYGAAPVEGADPASSPRVNAGVLAHVVERVLGGEATRDEADPSVTGVASVGSVFETAQDAGIPLRVLREAGSTATLPWSDDARARLEASLASGWLAVAPERPVLIGGSERIGWWLVDPATGRTVDELDDGRGSAPTDETIILTRVSLRNAAAKRRFGKCLAGAAFAVGEGISGYLAQGEIASGNTLEGVLMGVVAAGAGVGAVASFALGKC